MSLEGLLLVDEYLTAAIALVARLLIEKLEPCLQNTGRRGQKYVKRLL